MQNAYFQVFLKHFELNRQTLDTTTILTIGTQASIFGIYRPVLPNNYVFLWYILSTSLSCMNSSDCYGYSLGGGIYYEKTENKVAQVFRVISNFKLQASS